MTTFVRRFLVLTTVMFWQGGFTFYAAVVVAVGSEVLGSHRQQGLVTQAVTNYLNLAGLAALLVWAWDIAAAQDGARRRRLLRWTLWTLLALTLAGLAWLHVRLDELIEARQIVDPDRFYQRHAWYLNISTAQWAASLILTAATLSAWRAEDSRQVR